MGTNHQAMYSRAIRTKVLTAAGASNRADTAVRFFTCTMPGQSTMSSGGEAALSRDSIQEGLRKLHEAIDISKRGRQPQRNAHRAAALQPHSVQKIIKGGSFLAGEVLYHRILRHAKGHFARARITETAGAQGEVIAVGSLIHY